MAKRGAAKKMLMESFIEAVQSANTFEDTAQVESTEVVSEKKKREKVVPINPTEAQMEELYALQSTSAKIRWLASEGFKTGQIADFLKLRYQHVRNVLTTPLKRANSAATAATAE